MSWAVSFVHFCQRLMHRQRIEEELDDEVHAYFEALAERHMARGLSREEARRAVRVEFDVPEQVKEKVRNARMGATLETTLRDIRYACRVLQKSPGFTAIAALSLAIGIGANTAIFSAIHATLLRPLPYKEPGRLAMLWLDNRRLGLHEDLTSYPNYEDWKKNRAFVDLAGFVPTQSILTGLEEPVRLADALVTSNFFPVLGVQPARGRSFSLEEEEPARGRVVILSHGLWQRQYASDPQVLGKIIELNSRPHQIIGVMPAGFAFPSKETQLWRPLAQSPHQRANRGGFFLSVVGRLKPGISWEQARTEMSGIGARLEAQYPDQDKGYGVWVVPLLDQVVGKMRQALLVLLLAVTFVLLIACMNAANLFLGRGAVRGREIAVRAALGAGRARLVRQLLTESIVLSVMAGALGLAIAFWGIRGLVLLAPQDLPRLGEISVDGPVLAFTLAVSAMAGILSGMFPALRISRVDLNEALREGGRSLAGGKRLRYIRSGLTVAEVAFSMILLTGAGLMIRSLLGLESVRPGFQTDNVLTWRISVSRANYTQGAEMTAFYTELLGRLQSLPGVKGAAAITDIFLSITPNSAGFTVEGRPSLPPEQQIEATIDSISSNYFQTMGVPLIHGRFFDQHDGQDTLPVVLVNETMARRFWPNEDAIGKRFKFGDPDPKTPWLTVVGVVGDMRRQGMDKQARSETFLPIEQAPSRGLTLVVHATDPAKAAVMVRGEVRTLDKSAILYERSTIADQIGGSLSQRRFETFLLGLFSLLALILATVGIYGVVFQSVAQRINELGIRMALGARRSSLLRMIVGESLSLVGLGAIMGGFAAFAISRALSSFLYSVTAADPITYLIVLLLLAAAAALASVIPARRATSVDPIHALRYE